MYPLNHVGLARVSTVWVGGGCDCTAMILVATLMHVINHIYEIVRLIVDNKRTNIKPLVSVSQTVTSLLQIQTIRNKTCAYITPKRNLKQFWFLETTECKFYHKLLNAVIILLKN